MAPEVVRREAAPSADTDRYSLAVLLFFLLYGGHPLDGQREANIRCLDVPAYERLYGFDPLYIWDQDDDSNRPVPGIHDNPIAFRDMYPGTLADLFRRSFTDGLHYPSSVYASRSGERLLPVPSTASGYAGAVPKISMNLRSQHPLAASSAGHVRSRWYSHRVSKLAMTLFYSIALPNCSATMSVRPAMMTP